MTPLVIAHRGASAERPENTLPAYELAVAQGADMIEIDLHRTRDGALVVTHDGELEGLGGSGPIGAATLAQVRELDAGGGERVPTLDEVLDGFGARIALNLELKEAREGIFYEGLEAAVLEAVRARGLLATTLLSCFAEPVLARLRQLEPRARLALLVMPRNLVGSVERARGLGGEAINPWFGVVTPEWTAAAHGRGLAVYPFTVDEPRDMERLVAAGVDGMFTNHPARLRGLVGPPRERSLPE